MNPNIRWIVAAAGALAVVVLFVVLRPGGSSSDSGSSPSPVVPTATSEPSTGGGGPVIDVAVRDGQVQGRREFEVALGDRVRIVVHADVTDEVHVHGYDLHADVAPGEAAEIEFRASATGVFEVELEDGGLLLFELRVAP